MSGYLFSWNKFFLCLGYDGVDEIILDMDNVICNEWGRDKIDCMEFGLIVCFFNEWWD